MKGKYEALFIFRPLPQDDKLQVVIKKALDEVTTRGGQISKSEPWGKKTLAYPIKKEREGVYYYIEFDLETGKIAELRREYSLTAEIVRVLILTRQ